MDRAAALTDRARTAIVAATTRTEAGYPIHLGGPFIARSIL